MTEVKEYQYDIESKVKTIDSLKSVLATMILIPTETSDPNNIGHKILGAPVQRPIVEGKARELVQNKLLELVNSL